MVDEGDPPMPLADQEIHRLLCGLVETDVNVADPREVRTAPDQAEREPHSAQQVDALVVQVDFHSDHAVHPPLLSEIAEFIEILEFRGPEDEVVAVSLAVSAAVTNSSLVIPSPRSRVGKSRARMRVRLLASPQAMALGLYPGSSMAAKIRWRVSSEMGRVPLIA
jgi:hypothetical protein